MTIFANDFGEIPSVLANNDDLRQAVLALVQTEPMQGKVTEGGNRLQAFRSILLDLVDENMTLEEAIRSTNAKLSPDTSPYASNNRVFPKGWAERLVRIQFSRFYNQAVLEWLRAKEVAFCFVPHSSREGDESACTQQLAGTRQSVEMLYHRLINAYANGTWSREAKIPNHPHCTHVVKPIEDHAQMI